MLPPGVHAPESVSEGRMRPQIALYASRARRVCAQTDPESGSERLTAPLSPTPAPEVGSYNDGITEDDE